MLFDVVASFIAPELWF